MLFIVVTLTFLLVRSAPGSPFASEKKIPDEILQQLQQEYDLNGPLWHQYAQYMWKVAHGDLSISTQYRNRSVNEIIAQTLPVSMTLGSLAYCLALLFGITLGAWAAVRHNTWGDRALMLVALLGISIPTFVHGADSHPRAGDLASRAAGCGLGFARPDPPARGVPVASLRRLHCAAHARQPA